MLASWKKSYDQPRQHIKKQRHYFANKGPSRQIYSFSSSHVWMWEFNDKESWVPKNWCFELWYWRRLLRVPWTARRSNQSIPKDINPEFSFEGLMLKMELQYSSHLMWRTDSLEKPWFWERMKVRGEGNNREWDGWMETPTWGTWVWASSWSWWWTGKPGVLQSMGLQTVRHDLVTKLTELILLRTWWARLFVIVVSHSTQICIWALSAHLSLIQMPGFLFSSI